MQLVASTQLYLYERMRLTVSIKKVCTYEKMCTYKKGALNNLSLRYKVSGLDFILYPGTVDMGF